MTQERIDIVVTTAGIVVARSSIAGIGSDAKTAATGVNTLRTALAGLGAGFTLKSLFNELDRVSQIKTRIGAIAQEGENVNDTFLKLSRSANAARSPLDDTVRLYQRVGFTLQSLGRTADESIRVTELLSKAYQLSGATANEAAQSARQFTQALNRGRLGEQELNSVLEEGPGLSKAIAEGFRLTEAELAKLNDTVQKGRTFLDANGKQLEIGSLTTQKYRTIVDETGKATRVLEQRTQDLTSKQKISNTLLEKLRANQGVAVSDLKTLSQLEFLTGTKFLDAVERSGKAIDERFRKIPVTLTQAVTVVRNQLDVMFLKFDQSTGIVNKTGQAILSLADNTNLLEGAITALAVVAIPLALAALATLFKILVGSGIGLFIIALGAAAGALVAFRKEITFGEGGLTNLEDVARGVAFAFGEMASSIRSVKDIFPIFNDSVDRFNGTVGVLLPSLKDLVGIAFQTPFVNKEFPAPSQLKNILKKEQDDLLEQSDFFLEKFKKQDKAIREVAEGIKVGVVGPQSITSPTVEQSRLFSSFNSDKLEKDVTSTFDNILNSAKTLGSSLAAAIVPDDLKDKAKTALAPLTEQVDKINQAVQTGRGIGSIIDSIINSIRQPLFGFISGLTSAITELAAIIQISVAKIIVAVAEFAGTADTVNKVTKDLASSDIDLSGAADRIRSSFEKGFVGGKSTLFENFGGNVVIGSILAKATREANELSSALDEVAPKVEQVEKKLEQPQEQKQNFFTQLTKGVDDFGILLTSTFANIENVLVSFTTTGKFNFNSFINAMISDITRFAFRALILKPIFEAIGGSSFSQQFGASGNSIALGIGKTLGRSLKGFSLPGFASGGLVGGPGGPTSDSLFARLSAGEFVTNAAATSRNGPALDFINRGGTIGDAKNTSTVFAPVINITMNGVEGSNKQQGQEVAAQVQAAVRVEFNKLLAKQKRPGGQLQDNKASY